MGVLIKLIVISDSCKYSGELPLLGSLVEHLFSAMLLTFQANIRKKLSKDERLALVRAGREDKGKYQARTAIKKKKVPFSVCFQISVFFICNFLISYFDSPTSTIFFYFVF